jgi:lysophospholipase L1-like esterase
MFGDSTTARRPGLVKEPYSVRVQRALEAAGSNLAVANQGIGGNSTRGAMARFESDVLALNPRIVVLQFGINDAAVDVWQNPPATSPRVPPAEFAANLRQMVQTLRRRDTKVILMTTNRIYWSQVYLDLYGRAPYDVTDPEGFNRHLLDHYNHLIREVAAAEQVPLVDINAAYAAHPNPAELLLPDLLHPGDAGHELVAKLLVPVILKM